MTRPSGAPGGSAFKGQRVKTTLRLPVGLYNELTQYADETGSDYNSLICDIVEGFFARMNNTYKETV